MDNYEATERAYKNGYEVGKRDALKWIPVSERLPDDGIPSTSYLCWWNGCRQVCKYSRTRKCFTFNGRVMDVTHWMPLPEPPKEGQR